MVIAVGGIALAWLWLVVSAVLMRRRAALVRDAVGRTAELGRPLSPAVEERLSESAEANMIVYGGGRSYLPFLGSGQRVRDWKFEVDVTRGAPGNDLDPIPFTEVELNDHLDMSFIGDMNERLTGLHRLYVDGRSVRPVPDDTKSWRGRFGAQPGQPLQYAGDAVLTEVAAEDESFRRVYFCLQQTARNGELVVSLFVRPRLEGRVLYIEIALHALLPLAGWVLGPVVRLNGHPLDVLGRSVSEASRLLTGPIGRIRRDVQRGRRRSTRRRRALRAGRRDRSFDCGANISLREGISIDDLEEAHYNVLMDVVTIGASLQNRLLSALHEFLVAHRIDTAEFDQTKRSIVTTIQTWNVNQVKAEMVGFGNNNDFTSGTGGSGSGPKPEDQQGGKA